MPERKVTSVRLSNFDQERIQDLKKYYADVWGIKPEEISTTDIISWSIGIAWTVKVEHNSDLKFLWGNNKKTDEE